jgi:hypothetical protein
MYQIIGTQKIHPFAAINMTTGEQVTTLTTPVCSYRINGGSVVTPYAFTISAYNATMKTFSITVPIALAANAYDSIEISIVASEGEAHLIIDVVPNPATYATAASISTLNNISQAQVLTQVQSALNSYDAPTKAEMDSGLALLATADNLSTANTNISVIKAKTDNLPSSIPTAAQIVAAFDTDVIDGTYTRIQVERIVAAALAGADDRSAATRYLKSLDGTKNRIAYTDSATGRVIVSRDGS